MKMATVVQNGKIEGSIFTQFFRKSGNDSMLCEYEFTNKPPRDKEQILHTHKRYKLFLVCKMSLFTTKQCWSAAVDAKEEFGKNSLCTGNIDNHRDGSNKIITGSYAGMLRVYSPTVKGYRVEDLMVEQALGAPILQLEIGRFLPSSNLLALAVLHPRELVVYQVAAMGGNGNGASYHSIVKVYNHSFNNVGQTFTAANMTHGEFGSNRTGRDFLCVQSMGGKLFFYEQDHFTFAVQLETCLVPGPLVFCPSSDCIVTTNTKSEIVAFKYQVLASASRSHSGIDKNWCINIGEHAVDIFVAKYTGYATSTMSDIIVVGEASTFFITDQGTIHMQKRMGFFPAACCTYWRTGHGDCTDDDRRENLIIATHSRRMLVFRDSQLVWTARVLHVPIAFCVSDIGGVKGLLISLGEDGGIMVSYLGEFFFSRVFFHVYYFLTL
jgi:Bardet-Biedl syndrome 9 protein